MSSTRPILKAKPKPDFATQSGPMLVIDGQIHPKISADGPRRRSATASACEMAATSRSSRSSERPVTFGAFARLFKDDLGCRNALFLDGSVSSLYAPNLGTLGYRAPAPGR